MIRAAEVVREAIAASGTGEPWCVFDDRLPDAVRAGNRLILVETDTDERGRPAGLGWLITVYAVDGGDATPVAVHVAETKNAARRGLTSLIRQTGRPVVERPLTWTREKPGLYRSGKYLVGHLDTGEWFGEGPGVDQVYDSKADAQAACDAARGR
ncbi:hypothetical protein JDV09_11325 [Mycobacterium sp. Y57]|uniref:hypothetical protein n=1 Tax=Mycolicibacterium xanthum TaxID=2796469 RepID=UPI001C853090|nr:hypothetical protein [Mycolicibacterium xanthum]MBX7432690.1 hypothetical protein [Mycolicibacterium xanthum]